MRDVTISQYTTTWLFFSLFLREYCNIRIRFRSNILNKIMLRIFEIIINMFIYIAIGPAIVFVLYFLPEKPKGHL